MVLAAVEDATCKYGYGVNKVISHRTLLGAGTVLLLDHDHRIREGEGNQIKVRFISDRESLYLRLSSFIAMSSR